MSSQKIVFNKNQQFQSLQFKKNLLKANQNERSSSLENRLQNQETENKSKPNINLSVDEIQIMKKVAIEFYEQINEKKTAQLDLISNLKKEFIKLKKSLKEKNQPNFETLIKNRPGTQVGNLLNYGLINDDEQKEFQEFVRNYLDKQAKQEQDQLKKDRTQALKLCFKVWSGYSKLIRSQCQKGNLVNSILFGYFYLNDQQEQSLQQEDKTFVYIPENLGRMFKINEKENNCIQEKISDEILKQKKNVLVNLELVGQVCNCSQEKVNFILQKIKEQAIQECNSKFKTVNINFLFGKIVLYPNGQIDFKNIKVQQKEEGDSIEKDQKNNLIIFNKGEKMKEKLESLKQKILNKKQNSLKNDGQEQLFKFLQSYSSQDLNNSRDKISFQFDKKTQKFPNKLIKIASQQIQEVKNYKLKMSLQDSYSQNEKFIETENQQNQSYFNSNKSFSPLLKNYMKQKGKERQQEDFKKSSQSNRISFNKLGNLIDKKSHSSIGKQLNIEQSKNFDKRDIMQIAQKHNFDDQKSMLSQYFNNPIQSQNLVNSVHQSNRGISIQDLQTLNHYNQNLNKTISAKCKSSLNFNKPQNLESVFKQKNNESQVFSSLIKVKSELIGDALNRKTISKNYRVAYPLFMQANGPFKIYEHAKEKGNKIYSSFQSANQDAHNRFYTQINDIKEQKISQQKQIDKLQSNQAKECLQRYMLRTINMKKNTENILKQIQIKNQNKKNEQELCKLNYKTHFGPEDTELILQKQLERAQAQKIMLNDSLRKQILLNQFRHEQQSQMDFQNDQQNILNASLIQTQEENAILQKKEFERLVIIFHHYDFYREELKRQWKIQVEDRKLQKQTLELFE